MAELDFLGFEHHLRKFGKKPHVVDGLKIQVGLFAAFLEKRQKTLDQAGEQEILDYIAELEAGQPGSGRVRIRGVALYYQYVGKPVLAAVASKVRDRAIAKNRKVFKLKDFLGVNPEHIAHLQAIGISNVGQMLDAGKTPLSRQGLADQTGIPIHAILELVKLSDLSRIGGLKAIRTRLYYDAGADTPEVIAGWEPEALCKMLTTFVEHTGFNGTAPLPKEVLHTIETSRQLQKIIEY